MSMEINATQGVEMGGGGTVYETGYITGGQLTSGTAYWDAENKTLTLTNIVCNSAIYLNQVEDITIVLVGENKVNPGNGYIICINPTVENAKVTIQGSGMLSGITTGNIGVFWATSNYPGTLTIKDCSMFIQSKWDGFCASNNGSGTPPVCDLVINNAMVNSLATNETTSAGGFTTLRSITLTDCILASPAGAEIYTENNFTGIYSDNTHEKKAQDVTILPTSKVNEQHTITIATVAGGTASASVSSAKFGDEVVLTATPDNGYVLTEYTANYGKIEGGAWYNTTGTLSMPFADVTITPIFSNDVSDLSINMPKDGSTIIADLPDMIEQFTIYDEDGSSENGVGSSMGGGIGNIQVNVSSGHKVVAFGGVKMWGSWIRLYDGQTTDADLLCSYNPGDYNLGFQPIGLHVSSGNSMLFNFNPTDRYADLQLTVQNVAATTTSAINGLGSLTGGTLAAQVDGSNATTALVGKTVTLSATPQTNYRLASITAEDAEGNEIPVTGGTFYNTTATFTMPATAVTLTATFTDDLSADGGLYALLPATGTLALDEEDLEGITSFKLYDDGGVNHPHSVNTDASVSISAASNKIFLFEGITSFADGYSNSLKIYDGLSTSGDVLVNQESSGGFENITSSSHLALVKLMTNTSNRAAHGVDITVEICDNVPNSIAVNSAAGGTVTPAVDSARPGEEVTLNIAPDSGYKLQSIAIKNASNQDIAFTGGEFYQSTITFYMPPSAVTVTPTFTSDFTAAGGLFATLPATGTLELSSEQLAGITSFKVYDDGGKDNNYSNTCEGYLKINAPDDKIIMVEGTVTSEGSTSNRYDYLTVFNGATTSSAVLGNAQYGISEGEDVGTLVGSHTILLRFISDGSNVKEGLDLTVTFIDPSGSAISVASVAGGTATASQSKSSPGETITLTATPNSGYKCIGYNVVDDQGNDIRVEYKGWYSPTATFVMPLYAVTVTPVFSNDPANWYINIPASGTEIIPNDNLQDVTSFKIYDDGGSSNNYSSSCAGYLTIIAPSGKGIAIQGTATTEAPNYDWLTLYNGEDDTAPVLGNEKYGTSEGEAVGPLQAGNMLTLYFRSDSGVEKDGLDLTISFYDLPEYTITITNASGGTLSAPSTDFYSEKVTVTINPDDGKYLASYTINGGEPVTIPWYAASFSFIMPQEDVTITPVFADLPEELVVKIPDTGSSQAVIPANITSFKVQDYNGSENYGDSWRGSITITVPEGCTMHIQGTCLTEATGYDWMTIYNGPTEESSVLGENKYGNTYGEYSVVSPLLSSGNVVTVFFRSDSSSNQAGPDLTVTVVHPGDINFSGEINVDDVETLADMLAGKTETTSTADVNNDGKVSAADIAELIEIIKAL